jgi:hypothetical protein
MDKGRGPRMSAQSSANENSVWVPICCESVMRHNSFQGRKRAWIHRPSGSGVRLRRIDRTAGKVNPRPKPTSLFDAADTAVAEIHSRFPWSRDVEPEHPAESSNEC